MPEEPSRELPAEPGPTSESEAARLRREAARAKDSLEGLGERMLEDDDRHREQLAADLTGELPNDSPEPA